jgi:hypothetical protein
VNMNSYPLSRMVGRRWSRSEGQLVARSNTGRGRGTAWRIWELAYPYACINRAALRCRH